MEKLSSFCGRVLKTIEVAADGILKKIPESKRKPALICAGATVFLLIVVTAVTIGQDTEKPVRQLPTGPILAISGDELFVPAEPDFLPDYLPERWPRANWGIEEIGPFWKDPGQGNLESWRQEMGAAIDRLMETVP